MTEKSAEEREGDVNEEEGDDGSKGPPKEAVDAAAKTLSDRKKDEESR